MGRKAIHFTIPERLMERFERCLEAEGLTKTVFLSSKIQEFCDRVESKKVIQRARGYSDEDVEYAMRESKASFEIEGLPLPEGAEELIRQSLRGRSLTRNSFGKR